MKTLPSTLLLLALTLGPVAAASAQTVSPNPAPTIITTAPYTITKPGYYQLGADLTVSATSGAIITINASNVTLDFGGHYISGPSNAPGSFVMGVSSTEEGNLTIQNGTIAFCYEGVILSGNTQPSSLNINQRVQNMLVSYCYYVGIYLYHASNSALLDNRVSFIGGSTGNPSALGIDDDNGKGDSATGNTVTSVTSATGGYGVYGIAGGSGLSVSNNKVSDVTNTGSSNTGFCYGIYGAAFAVGNTVTGCAVGFYDCSKYANNLTTGCTTPFSGGSGFGYNN